MWIHINHACHLRLENLLFIELHNVNKAADAQRTSMQYLGVDHRADHDLVA